ncbi:XRE family transcriptional regulator [Erysipelothrix piscisicarius]|uniref:XRE family transcriptional regulator n=1 Tax=Erysipelothrix piscisicarius TaxID=2485784 RepID=A0A3S8RL09_9FIRM|nr:helix-turn-helix transcriptional regulator [Erysipelothrix piscisicarius]AZK43527.1 XRE family transcriptional regulator [Erysipelothrix piscisicarius]
MGLSYDKLWKLLIDKKMSAADLRKAINVAPNTMTKMRQDQIVSLAVLMKICDELDCDFGDIVSYIQ